MPKRRPRSCPTTPSWNDCAIPALISPAARSRNTAKRWGFPPRCSAAVTSKVLFCFRPDCDECRRSEVLAALAASSPQGLQIEKRYSNHRFASAHDFPKFVKVFAAMNHELRKVGTRRWLRPPQIGLLSFIPACSVEACHDS